MGAARSRLESMAEDHRGESPRTATADSIIDLGVAASIVQGADINAHMFHPIGAPYRSRPAEFAGQVRAVVRHGEVLVGRFPFRVCDAVVTVVERRELPADAKLSGGIAGLDGNYYEGLAGAKRDELELLAFLADDVGDGEAYSNYGGFAGGRATGIVDALLQASNLTERIRWRLLPFAGVVATSTAITGLMSAGTVVTTAAGLGLLALLLAGIWVIMIHVLRA